MNEFKEVSIVAVNKIRKRDLTDDTHVPGTYSVMVKGGVSEALMATAALDAFHTCCPVSSLEDFNFWPFDPETGKVLEEDPEQNSYQSEHLARDLIRISDEVPRAYGVTVYAAPKGLEPQAVKQAIIVAENKQVAGEKALSLLWKPENQNVHEATVTVAVLR